MRILLSVSLSALLVVACGRKGPAHMANRRAHGDGVARLYAPNPTTDRSLQRPASMANVTITAPATAAEVSNLVSNFVLRLELAELFAGAMKVEDLTDDRLRALIALLPHPWDLERLFQDTLEEYRNTNRVAVAERVMRYLIDHVHETKAQAFARWRLGGVLQWQGKLGDAIAMLESVPLSSEDTEDWYVTARMQATAMSLQLMKRGANDTERDRSYDRAVMDCRAAIAASADEKRRAGLYRLLACVHRERDQQKALEAFETSVALYERCGETDEAASARKARDDLRRNLGKR